MGWTLGTSVVEQVEATDALLTLVVEASHTVRHRARYWCRTLATNRRLVVGTCHAAYACHILASEATGVAQRTLYIILNRKNVTKQAEAAWSVTQAVVELVS